MGRFASWVQIGVAALATASVAVAKEPTAPRIITLHNVAWLLRFMDQMADAIRAGTFEDFRAGVHEVWAAR